MRAVVLVSLGCLAHAISPTYLHRLGPQGVNLWKLHGTSPKPQLFVQDTSETNPLEDTSKPEFEALWFEQPLDHFDQSIHDTFFQRYWINTRHYKPGSGAPVIVLDGGETSGEVRNLRRNICVFVLTYCSHP